jgi:hypothetical protein
MTSRRPDGLPPRSKASFERPALREARFTANNNEHAREREVAMAIDISEPTMVQLRIRSGLLQGTN